MTFYIQNDNIDYYFSFFIENSTVCLFQSSHLFCLEHIFKPVTTIDSRTRDKYPKPFNVYMKCCIQQMLATIRNDYVFVCYDIF